MGFFFLYCGGTPGDGDDSAEKVNSEKISVDCLGRKRDVTDQSSTPRSGELRRPISGCGYP